MSTPTPSQKIQQYVDNQQFETAYKILVEEQKKLFEAVVGKEELFKRSKVLAEAFLDLTYPIDELTLDVKLELECCLRAEEIHERVWDKPDDLLIRIYNYKGYIFNALCQTEEARKCYEFILSICDKCSNPYCDKMEAYHGIAFAYEDDEELEMALRYFKQSEIYLNKAAIAAPDTPLVSQEGSLHNAFATTYARMQQYDKAIKHSRKSMATIGESHPNYPFPVFNLARNLYFKKEYQASIDMLETIKEKYQCNTNLLSRFSIGLADSYKELGHHEKAENILLESADVFENTNIWHAYVPAIFSRLAELYLQKNDHAKAVFYIEKSLQNCKSRAFYFRLLLIQSKIQLSQNQYLNTLKTIQKVDILADEIRRNHKTQASRLLLAEQAKDLYERGVETAFFLYEKTNDKQFVELAFRYAEKSKAILLLMEIKHQDGMLSAEMPSEVLKQEKDILRQLNYLDKMLEGEHKLPEVAEKRFKEERFELQREHEIFIQKLEQDYPDYYQQKYNTEPTSIADLQERLSDKRLIMSYFVGEENTYIFRIGKERIDMEKLGKTMTIREQVMEFRELLEKRVTMPLSFEQQATALYDILLKSTLKNSQTDQLLIVPDDVLAQLPFEALVTQRMDNNLNFNELNYLLNDYEVVYHFSATLWHYGLKKYERRQRSLSFVGFAPMYEGEVQPEQVERGQYERDLTYRDKVCHKLPFAKQEVEQIAGFFEQKKLCVDAVATKDNFVAYCTQGTYLHIAAHGFYSKKKDEDCYIQFSPSDKDDIRLTINDIASLKIDAHLIVLSCCNTGQGQFRKGESVFALNRSFMAAGGQNIISTLFKVPDALACELMTNMYEKHLNEKRNVAPSLRAAKLQLIEKEGITPKMWCGYQLVGN